MRRVRVSLLILFSLASVWIPFTPAAAFTPTPVPQVTLLSPGDGAALQGRVSLIGEIKGGGIVRVDLSFAHPGQGERTWFFIREIDPAEAERFQADWDTSLITDGIYDLRLQVEYNTGLILNHIIREVRIRNYSPIETHTPAPTWTPAASPQESAVPTFTSVPSTPTPLPPNPASVERRDVIQYIGYGLLAALGLFALAGVYLGARKMTGW
jgi:hypothetical protein